MSKQKQTPLKTAFERMHGHVFISSFCKLPVCIAESETVSLHTMPGRLQCHIIMINNEQE